MTKMLGLVIPMRSMESVQKRKSVHIVDVIQLHKQLYFKDIIYI